MTAGLNERSRWELSAESVVVKLRWFGVVMGYILVQTRTGLLDPWAVRVSGSRGGICGARSGVLAHGRGFSQALAALRFVDGIGLHHAAVLLRHRAVEPVSLVLSALIDLLLDSISLGRGMVDVRFSQFEPARAGPNLRALRHYGIRACR